MSKKIFLVTGLVLAVLMLAACASPAAETVEEAAPEAEAAAESCIGDVRRCRNELDRIRLGSHDPGGS